MALRYKKANVTHPELKATFQLPIIGVKKNPQSPMYTQLGVLTKGTIIEVNISELGMVTTGGKVVWAKYAQITVGDWMDVQQIFRLTRLVNAEQTGRRGMYRGSYTSADDDAC